jgi:hypothetical protein
MMPSTVAMREDGADRIATRTARSLPDGPIGATPEPPWIHY